MIEGKEAWIPDDHTISAKSVMRMLYTMRDFLMVNNKFITNQAFSHFVDRFEEEIRNELENAPSQVPVIDFQKILEDE